MKTLSETLYVPSFRKMRKETSQSKYKVILSTRLVFLGPGNQAPLHYRILCLVLTHPFEPKGR